MMKEPVVVLTEARHYAGLHQVIPVAEIRSVMGPSLAEVYGAVEAQGLEPAGPWFTHHYHRPLETFDFEICVPVETAIEPDGRVEPGVWPAMKVARVVHEGSYAGLPGAWGELEEWILRQGLRPGAEFWERYVVNPEVSRDPAKLRTELNWPLRD